MVENLIEIAGDGLHAAINPLGAELSSLRDAEGRQLMTDADPAFWTGRAPILFPIVGQLNGDALRIDGTAYTMQKHGFARRMRFAVTEHTASAARFRLTDNPDTRAAYPFPFVLEIGFAIEDATLTMTARIANPGAVPLPASFGWHPAFAWPLPYGEPRAAHRVTFAADEPEPIALLADGLIAPTPRPSPLDGRALRLDDALFERDALIWNPVHSQSVRYGAAGGPSLDIAFPDTPRLGIWTKPGAHYVCIEPWHGIADPEGFAGDFRDKPGVFEIAPGADWHCSLHVTLRE
ncbi:aldose 1-epimerase family protein [Sphingomonas sp. AR_OL41]|uniref:aldose 1-epimerase family protein n=1 Tax=Sphingomonas sp. AR_OL41 TaxID=3042729 RepID=UPI00247FE46C|nr:aldose 1-epimerase family protein [Sphingomonas sp. AR_OL41]MDH7973418.1 aldose 1-epimerase family protein [Sphingomonas sp. AR_OL41]